MSNTSKFLLYRTPDKIIQLQYAILKKDGEWEVDLIHQNKDFLDFYEAIEILSAFGQIPFDLIVTAENGTGRIVNGKWTEDVEPLPEEQFKKIIKLLPISLL